MSGNIPSYSKIGAAAKEVLTGGREGVYQYTQKATVSARTVDGVDYTASITKQDKDALAVSLKTAYAADKLKFTGTFTQAGKVVASVQTTEIVPGLTANLTGTIPDASTAKLGIDYVLPHLTVNGNVNLTSSPVLNVAATTGRSDMFAGGEATFNTSNNQVTAWTVGAGLTRKDFQVGISLLDKGQAVKAVYAHNITPTSSAAAEILRRLSKQEEPTHIALGYQKRLDTGALAKIRVESSGLTSLHYETMIQPKNKVGISAQLDAKDLSKQPKLGGFIDVSH